jgi:hypothetical protein
MKNVLLIVSSALLIAGPAAAQKPAPVGATAAAPGAVATPMRPGLWEITVVVETVGSNSKRTIVSRACYAATDVADIARVLPRQREPGMKCENRDAKTQGTSATWNVACTSPEGTLTGAADLSLTGTTYSGHADLERKKRGAKAEKVAEALSAKWIEACK